VDKLLDITLSEPREGACPALNDVAPRGLVQTLEAAVTGLKSEGSRVDVLEPASGTGSLIACRDFPCSRADAANQSRRLLLEDLDIATCLQDFKGDLGIVMTVH
jgi:hypothetical protein